MGGSVAFEYYCTAYAVGSAEERRSKQHTQSQMAEGKAQVLPFAETVPRGKCAQEYGKQQQGSQPVTIAWIGFEATQHGKSSRKQTENDKAQAAGTLPRIDQ